MTVEAYALSNFEAANLTLVVSEKIKISHLRNAYTTAGPREPYFLVKEQICLIVYTSENEALESQFPKL